MNNMLKTSCMFLGIIFLAAVFYLFSNEHPSVIQKSSRLNTSHLMSSHIGIR